MRYRFVFVVTLAILAAAPLVSHGQEAGLTAQLSVCKKGAEPPRGVVLVSPDAPHKPIKVFCADELKRFDCQILAHITNYIFYSYGRCENNDMYKQIFGRPACSQVLDQATRNEIRPFINTLLRTEYVKGCLPPNFTPDF
jgi:hypothetical protein